MSKKKTVTIKNIGYQGRTIEQFLETLQGAKVQLLVDLREKPVSRLRGFSKHKLCEALRSVGIEYLPCGKELGGFTCTKEQWIHGCNMLAGLAQNKKIVMMCMERDPLQCHRMELAKILKDQHGIERECL